MGQATWAKDLARERVTSDSWEHLEILDGSWKVPKTQKKNLLNAVGSGKLYGAFDHQNDDIKGMPLKINLSAL